MIRKKLVLPLILVAISLLLFFSNGQRPVQAFPGWAAPACSSVVKVTGGFLRSNTITLEALAKTGGTVALTILDTNGAWTETQLLTPSVGTGAAIKVRFSTPNQPGNSSAYRKVQLNIGGDCYIMQAAAAAPFLLGYQYRFTTQTLDYIYMRAVNSKSLYTTYIIADIPENPEYYDVELNTLAIVPTNQSRRYYEVYTAMDVNTFPNYAKLQFFAYTLGGTPARPTDLTFADFKPNTSVYDYNPVVAVAPNGAAAVAFRRAQSTSQLGITFIDPSGKPVYPAGCANGCIIGNTDGVTQNISIAATKDNHFIVAWERETESGALSKKDIGIAVYDAVTYQQTAFSYPLLGDLASSTKYSSPNLATFSKGEQVYLSYIYETSAGQVMYGRKLNQNGSLTDPQQTILPSLVTFKPYDSAYLDDKHILISWVNGTNLEPKEPMATVFNPDDATHTAPVSLAVDGTAKERVGVVREYYGRGVITWATQDTSGRLFYASMNAQGGILTPPMLHFESNEIQLGSGRMATAFLPEPMFQLNIPLLRK
jgi:hypothetical protein